MEPSSKTILVVDDCPEDRTLVRRLLGRTPGTEAFSVVEAASGQEGLALVGEHEPDCILLDYNLFDLTGIEFVAELQEQVGEEVTTPIIMLTGQSSEAVAIEALRVGIADFIPKSEMDAGRLAKAVIHSLERTRIRRELQASHAELERTVDSLRTRNREITGFYHNLSHELKTPLTGAKEFVALLLDGFAGVLNPTQREYLEVAAKNCDLMVSCINDMLDASRLETGKLELRWKPVSVAALLGDVAAAWRQRAEAAGIELAVRVGDDLPPVEADEQRLSQVLGNLVSNAVKFTPRGGSVSLAARRAAPGDRIELAVQDTGRGISPEDRAHIFDRLYQCSAEDAAVQGGLGLGLSIARDLVHLHGSQLELETELGRGSTFSFNLPAWDPVPVGT